LANIWVFANVTISGAALAFLCGCFKIKPYITSA
jgi:hypothetical protein